MKYIPVLGALVLVGIVVQLATGFSGRAGPLIIFHIGVGYGGLALATVLAVVAWRRSGVTWLSRALITLFLIVVLGQAILGQLMLVNLQGLRLPHQYLGVTILVLAVVEAAVTSLSARRRAKAA